MAKKTAAAVAAPAPAEGVVAATPEAPKVEVPKDTKNGITRPTPGTATGKVWEIADAVSAETKAPAERKPVLAACKEAKINDATAQTQFGRWRTYHGLVTARAPAVAGATVAAPAPPAEVASVE